MHVRVCVHMRQKMVAPAVVHLLPMCVCVCVQVTDTDTWRWGCCAHFRRECISEPGFQCFDEGLADNIVVRGEHTVLDMPCPQIL